MPVNNGYFNRKARKEAALERRLKNISDYEQAEDKTIALATKLKIAETDVKNLIHNISLPKRGRRY